MNATSKTWNPAMIGGILLLSYCLIIPIAANASAQGEPVSGTQGTGPQGQGLLPDQQSPEKPNETPPQAVEVERSVSTITIDIVGGKFKFKEIHVGKGEPVRWVNFDSVPLVVKIGKTESPPLQDKSEWTYIFKEAGKYPFHLKSNPKEKGTIIVK